MMRMTAEIFIRVIADLAVIPVALIGAYALVFKIPKGNRYQAYCRILMAGLTSYFIAKMVSVIYQPATERPFESLGLQPGASYLDNPGFPSDHALFVTAIALAAWFETRNKIIGSVLAVLVVLVCVGRVLALVHTPLDIIGGVAIAALGAVWYIQTTVEKRGKHGNNSHRRSSDRSTA
jgi:membrane-associated phospholipid phosphatase